MANEKHKCCLCGRMFDGWGNNPAPLRDKGVCCDDCNGGVILARMAAREALAKQTTYIVKVAALGSVLSIEEFDGDNSLKQLQRCVGGLIERAPAVLPDGLADIDCYVDEEGLLKGVAIVNQPVTTLCSKATTQECVIVGDAVFAAHDEMGETLGLTEERCAALAEHLKSIGAITHTDFGRIGGEG